MGEVTPSPFLKHIQMACNCKNKINSYVDVSKAKEQDWEDVNSLIALDSCGEIIVAEKPDTLSPKDRHKIDSIQINEKGEKALFNDGKYKETYNAQQIDNKLKNYNTSEETQKKLQDYYTKQQTDENISAALEDYYTKEQTDKNISTNLEDYYSKEEINSTLQNAVFFDQDNNINTKNNIILGEKHKIITTQTSQQEKRLISAIDASIWDVIHFGSEQVNFNINSKNRPSVKTNQSQEAQNIAFLSDIQKTEENLQNQIDDVNTEIKENNNDLNQFKQETNNSISELSNKVEKNTSNIAQNASDILSLKNDFNAAEHFKGYFQTIDEITSLPAEKGAFAWCAETGTVWIYDTENQNGTWKCTKNPIPDQTVMPYDGLPLMDGEVQSGSANLYARGDHRHPSDGNKADKEELEALSEKVKDNYAQLESFKENTDNSVESISLNIQSIQKDICQNKKDIALNAFDITSLRNDFNAAEHFKGYFETIDEITNIPGEQGAFAWCAETGTVWIYNTEHQMGSWIDSTREIPDQTVFAYDAFPLMDGNAEPGTSTLYARGDHRHPADQNKADKNDLDNYLPLAGNSKENKITGDIYLTTGKKIIVSNLDTSYITQEENTQTTILCGAGGGGIDLQTPNGSLKYNGKQVATKDEIPDISNLIINGENDTKIQLSTPGFQVQTPNNIHLIHERDSKSLSKLTLNQFGLDISTSGKMYYNESEVATLDNIPQVDLSEYYTKKEVDKKIQEVEISTEIIAALKNDGDGTQFLANDGTYKELNFQEFEERLSKLETLIGKLNEDLENRLNGN